MSLSPTPVTAALAGVFSGLTWPILWPLLRDPSSSTLWLMLGTIVLIALPAHALVLGFQPRSGSRIGTMNRSLLIRIGAWLAAGTVTALALAAFWRSP